MSDVMLLSHAAATPCPFCGSAAEAQPWHGGGRDKHMVRCASEVCNVGPSVTGDSLNLALRRWNTRMPPMPDATRPLAGEQL